MTVGRHSPNKLAFSGLINLKDSFLKLYLRIKDSSDKLKLEVKIHKKKIPKNKLPVNKLIGMLEDEQVQFSNTKQDNSTLLQFDTGIFALSLEDGVSCVFKCFKKGYNPEMLVIKGLGMILYEKDKKDIKLVPIPLGFKKENKHITLYKSNNFLKRVVTGAANKNKAKKALPSFYICDESKYLKECTVEEDDGIMQLKIKKEYYVSQDFTGSKEFKVYGNLLITRNKWIRMQERGTENYDLNAEKRFEAG